MQVNDHMKTFQSFARARDFLKDHGYSDPEYLEGDNMSPLIGQPFQARFLPPNDTVIPDLREKLVGILDEESFDVIGVHPFVLIACTTTMPGDHELENMAADLLQGLCNMVKSIASGITQIGAIGVSRDEDMVLFKLQLAGDDLRVIPLPPDVAKSLGTALLRAAEDVERDHDSK